MSPPLSSCAARLLNFVGLPSRTIVVPPLSQGVEAVHVAPTEFLRRQIAAVLSDIGSDVVKTGMLPTPEVSHERVIHWSFMTFYWMPLGIGIGRCRDRACCPRWRRFIHMSLFSRM